MLKDSVRTLTYRKAVYVNPLMSRLEGLAGLASRCHPTSFSSADRSVSTRDCRLTRACRHRCPGAL